MIEKLIKESGFGIEETAFRLGIDASTVWRHFKNRTRPEVEILRRYADVFNVKFDVLLDFYYPPKDPCEDTESAVPAAKP